MNKQDEIREGVYNILNENYILKPGGMSEADCMVHDILAFLHFKRVRIEVFDSNKKSYFGIRLEPLIKE